MERLGSAVRRELGRFGPATGMADVVAAWPEAVGDAIARNAWPAALARDGTLHVSVSSAAWAFELAQLEAELRGRLAAALPETAPQRLRFAVGRVPEPPAEAEPPAAERRVEPSPEDVETARRLASAIEDDELRALVAGAAARSLAGALVDPPTLVD
jgi:hypothetical protein